MKDNKLKEYWIDKTKHFKLLKLSDKILFLSIAFILIVSIPLLIINNKDKNINNSSILKCPESYTTEEEKYDALSTFIKEELGDFTTASLEDLKYFMSKRYDFLVENNCIETINNIKDKTSISNFDFTKEDFINESVSAIYERVEESECVEKRMEEISKTEIVASFDQYPIKEIYTGKIAPLDLKSSKVAYDFRTTIRASLQNGVNFAGHYVISEWGFTGYGDEMAVIDVYNGKAYHFPYMAWAGFQYTSTSSLLIVNPRENILEYINSYCWPLNDFNVKPYYYVWDGNTFQPLQEDRPELSIHF